jgi:hypothetical protein
MLSKPLNIEICETIILPLVLHGFEIWSLAEMKEHRPKVFENWVLRKIFGSKRQEEAGVWRKIRKKGLHNFYFRQIFLGRPSQENEVGRTWTMERREMHAEFSFENLKDGGY